MEPLDQVRDMLKDFYTPEEIETWLVLEHPQLGCSAVQAIEKGRANEVFQIIHRLQDLVYL